MAFISSVEQLAAQLTDLGSPISELQVMSKILMSLPASYRPLKSAWDSVPLADRNLRTLTIRLIKEEKLIKLDSKEEERSAESALVVGNSFLNGYYCSVYCF